MERFKLIKLFAHTHKLDWAACDALERKRRTTAGVSIEFGENGAGDSQCLIKVSRHAHRFLTGGGIEYK